MRKFLVLWWLIMLAGCGSGGSSAPQPAATTLNFWAFNFVTNTSYQTTATKVAEGTHCYVYLENGLSSNPSAGEITAIVNSFDNAVYPGDTAAFGGEPNPGVDGDPKVYILLLNIKDGFGPGSPSFLAGYFDPNNEYAVSGSNLREILYMNVNPQLTSGFVPGSTDFMATVAHEFQHMIHWEQKTHQRGVLDDTWLDEAMAQVARTYCGFGPDYFSIRDYEDDPNHSLTNFDETIGNYGMVYLWAQYFKDRLGSSIFFTMLHNSLTGRASVNAALATSGSPKDFAATFRDWAIANYFGNGTTVTPLANYPEWSYVSVNTWPGTYTFNNGQDSATLPGLFTVTNATTLTPLAAWSLGFYGYTPSTPPNGTVTWSQGATSERAAFVNSGTSPTTVFSNATSGHTYAFATKGYLLFQNLSSASGSSSGATVAHTAVVATPAAAMLPASRSATASPRTPGEYLAAMNANPLVRRFVLETGRPRPVYLGPYFREREKALRATGARPPF